MAKSVINTKNLRKDSSSYTELFNDKGISVYALKSGRFEITCGRTSTYAHSLREVQEKINGLDLHHYPGSGEDVVASIKKKLGSQYRLEIKASKLGGGEETVFTAEGSRDYITEKMAGTTGLSLKDMNPGMRYAMTDNMYGGEYAILVPMSTVGLEELSPSFEDPQFYEKQPLSKGVVLHGIHPATQEPVSIIVDEAYPNGTIKDGNSNVWSTDDIDLYQFMIGAPSPIEEDFQEPDDSFYDSNDVPSYNPTGEVKEVAPMLGDLSNYDTILSASAGVLSDFMKSSKKAAYIDRSSLNKVTISGINDERQATDGEIQWNVRIASPYYKRSSQITIPMVIKNGSIDIGKEFITSTGHKYPLTVEAIKEHLGMGYEEDMFRFAAKEVTERHSSTIHADKDIDNLLNGIELESSNKEATGYGLHVLKNPNGTYSYAGSVPEELAYVKKDGSELSEKDIQDIHQVGPGMVGAKPRLFDTAKEAIEFAEERGFDVIRDADAKDASKKTGVAGGFYEVSIYVDDTRLNHGDNGYVKMTDDIDSTIEDVKAEFPGSNVEYTVNGDSVMIEVTTDTTEASKKTSSISEEFPVGSKVKPLRSKKRPNSSWVSSFGKGNVYEVVDYDSLDGEDLLVLSTGEGEDNYELVYPDEVVMVGSVAEDEGKEDSKKTATSKKLAGEEQGKRDGTGPFYMDGKNPGKGYIGKGNPNNCPMKKEDKDIEASKKTANYIRDYKPGDELYEITLDTNGSMEPVSLNEEGDTYVGTLEEAKSEYERIKKIHPSPENLGISKLVVDEDGHVQVVEDIDTTTASVNKTSSIYDSYIGYDGDTIFKIPYEFSNPEDVVDIAIEDEELYDFLYSELQSHEGIESVSGTILWGSDIQDFIFYENKEYDFMGDKEASKNKTSDYEGSYGDPKPGVYDADADDLVMIVENDRDLYNQMVQIYKNLSNKKKRGTYDAELAPKAFMYVVKPAAKIWEKETSKWADVPGDVVNKVTKDVIEQAAKEMVEDFEDRYENKEYDFMGDKEASKKTAQISKEDIKMVREEPEVVGLFPDLVEEMSDDEIVDYLEAMSSDVPNAIASKKTADSSNLIEYYFGIDTDYLENDAEEDGIDPSSEEVTEAAIRIEDNVLSWLSKNVGRVLNNSGHDKYGVLGGGIVVEKGSGAHKFIMAALEDNGEEPFSTGKGDFPFDPFDGVSDELARVFNVSLSFSRIKNMPEDLTDDYSDEPEADASAVTGAKKVSIYDEDVEKAKDLIDHFLKKYGRDSEKVRNAILENVVNNKYVRSSNSFVELVWELYKKEFPS